MLFVSSIVLTLSFPLHFNITCGADKSGRASKFVFFIAQNELSVKINITKELKICFLHYMRLYFQP